MSDVLDDVLEAAVRTTLQEVRSEIRIMRANTQYEEVRHACTRLQEKFVLLDVRGIMDRIKREAVARRQEELANETPAEKGIREVQEAVEAERGQIFTKSFAFARKGRPQ